LIEKRREERAKEVTIRAGELDNVDFFKKVNEVYRREKSAFKNAQQFANNVITFKNDNSKITAQKIFNLIKDFQSKI
jgi:hypothetical protein